MSNNNKIQIGILWVARFGFSLTILTLLAIAMTSAFEVRLSDLKILTYMHFDKAGHLLAMCLITIVSFIALPQIQTHRLIFFSIALAAAIELIQWFGPRSADIVDFGMSCAGTALAASVHYGLALRFNIRRPNHQPNSISGR